MDKEIIERFREKFPSINLNTNQDTKEPFNWVFVSGQKDLPLKIEQFILKELQVQKSQLKKEIIDWVRENTRLREVWSGGERDYVNEEIIFTKDIINFLRK